MQFGFVAGGLGLVQPVHPGADLVEIVGPGGNHQDAVEFLQGQDPDHAGHVAGSAVPAFSLCAENLAKCRLDVGDLGVFQRKYADGHPLELIDVEGGNHLHPAVELVAGARQNQQVALTVHADERRARGHRLEDFRHFRRADVFQRDDHIGITCPLAFRAGNAGHEAGQVLRGADEIAIIGIAHHNDAVGLQQ